MDKNVEIGLLCDIYGELLTEKQQNVLDLYYNENLSLAEVAEEVGITRQAVKDSILKGEKRLFWFRRKTRNYEKSTKTRKTNTEDTSWIIINPDQIHWRRNCKNTKKRYARIAMFSLN